MPFEPQNPINNALSGSIDVAVFDPNGLQPQTIIQTNDAWRTQVRWEMHGVLVPTIDGRFRVQVFLESMGGGYEGQVGAQDLLVTSVPLTMEAQGPTRRYTATLNILPNPAVTPGVYKLVTAVTYRTAANAPGPIAATAEGPLLQFYNPGQP